MIRLISLLLGFLLWGTFMPPFGLAGDINQAAVFEKSAPAVVVIWASREDGVGAKGTGSIIQDNGMVITNAHVVLEKNKEKAFERIAVVLFQDKNQEHTPKRKYQGYRAHVVALNKEWDLALLQIEGFEGKLPTLPLADARDVKIGDPVVAIGHPEQGALWTLTSGTISAKIPDFADRKGWDIFQTDTSINRGNSGGPLLDRNGHVVGINVSTARLAEDGFPITAVNFAIQSAVAQTWLKSQGVALAVAPSSPTPPKSKAHKSVEAVPADSGPSDTIQTSSSFEERAGRLRDLMQRKRDRLKSLRR